MRAAANIDKEVKMVDNNDGSVTLTMPYQRATELLSRASILYRSIERDLQDPESPVYKKLSSTPANAREVRLNAGAMARFWEGVTVRIQTRAKVYIETLKEPQPTRRVMGGVKLTGPQERLLSRLPMSVEDFERCETRARQALVKMGLAVQVGGKMRDSRNADSKKEKI